ncbi:hypothetical protein [Actinokineospora enzanensis]|uniref:hypothetical protein n=1 Tax=Actinokineospora enzanensis TaxID=155975 RepID=UPI00036906CE|nr:hypothetical protein [Actinokineospora enzanensis]
MSAVSSYTRDYVDSCRARVDAHVETYRALAGSGSGPVFTAAVAAFEPVFFNNLVLVLEQSFVHRLRDKELGDGNPLNEVRLLAASLLGNDGRLVSDPGIRMNPARSVLKYQVGDEIAVREAAFQELAAAFFADLERKYSV